ncbi:MAG: fumarylacetoacetate hydrolase family protein [Elusimicrobia bacterium]|nr:fumarylacetoacetate hydrolase family protein [Elusimicrobiota bacterium]
MKLVTFEVATPLGPVERLGALRGGRIVDLNRAAALLYKAQGKTRPQERADFFVPPCLLGLLDGGKESLTEAGTALNSLKGAPAGVIWKESQVKLLAPLPRPRSLRDFFSFEDHAKAGAKRRNEPMQKEWYEQPVFYKGNPRSIIGPGATIPWPAFTRKLDFEFEIAAVVGTAGRDISVKNARKHIAGYIVMNDCSARDIQRNEMACRMGPAKGKDFATAMGPYFVTSDEVTAKIPELKVRINGKEWSRSKGAQPYWNFDVMLSHASQGEDLLPGDLLGSGTYFTGCGLDMARWIKPGDRIELDAGPLGTLKNVVGKPAGKTHLVYKRTGAYA